MQKHPQEASAHFAKTPPVTERKLAAETRLVVLQDSISATLQGRVRTECGSGTHGTLDKPKTAPVRIFGCATVRGTTQHRKENLF